MKQSSKKGEGSTPPIYLQKFKSNTVSDHIPKVETTGGNDQDDR